MASVPSLPDQHPLARHPFLTYRSHKPRPIDNLRHSPLHLCAPTPPTHKHLRTHLRLSYPLHLDNHLSQSVPLPTTPAQIQPWRNLLGRQIHPRVIHTSNPHLTAQPRHQVCHRSNRARPRNAVCRYDLVAENI